MSFAVLKVDGAGEDIVFEASADKVRTWHDARRTGRGRWVKHEVYAEKPKKEFIGPDLDTITLSVRLDINHGLVPRDELRKMRALMKTGVVMQFSIGGQYFGDFSLESVDETWTRLDPKGVLTTAVVSLVLEEYA